MITEKQELTLLGGLGSRQIPRKIANGATKNWVSATPLITKSWSNIQPSEKAVRYGSSEPKFFTSFWWSLSIENFSEFNYPMLPADRQRMPNQTMLSYTLIHRLLFATLQCWATTSSIEKSRLMNGIGTPKSQAQAAALLGAWEGVGFLTKEGKGKTASYKIVDGYNAGNWPGATNEQRKQCYQRILRNIPLGINLNAVKIRAVCLKKITYEAADFTL